MCRLKSISVGIRRSVAFMTAELLLMFSAAAIKDGRRAGMRWSNRSSRAKSGAFIAPSCALCPSAWPDDDDVDGRARVVRASHF